MFIKNEEKASISIIKIICMSIILILISGIGVLATNQTLNDITIILQNGYEITVITTKTTVSEVLEENNIILTEEQKTIPEIDSKITTGQIIKIADMSYNEIQIAEISESGTEINVEDLLDNYAPITEEIYVEQIAIPYETITKNTVNTSSNTTNTVVQEGQDGLKEITYKIKRQNEIEIEKIVLSEIVIKEPVDKIVEVLEITTRGLPEVSATGSGTIFKVTAYCPCSICCGSYATGYTASGTWATAGRTIAASSQFAFGTKLNVGGQILVVEDRGGAITGNKIDLFVDTHQQALEWGVKYLPVTVVE